MIVALKHSGSDATSCPDHQQQRVAKALCLSELPRTVCDSEMQLPSPLGSPCNSRGLINCDKTREKGTEAKLHRER